jgi:threonine aldolase
MVYARVKAGAKQAAAYLAAMEANGVLAFTVGPLIRFVTSMLVTQEDCLRAAEIVDKITAK